MILNICKYCNHLIYKCYHPDITLGEEAGHRQFICWYCNNELTMCKNPHCINQYHKLDKSFSNHKAINQFNLRVITENWEIYRGVKYYDLLYSLDVLKKIMLRHKYLELDWSKLLQFIIKQNKNEKEI